MNRIKPGAPYRAAAVINASETSYERESRCCLRLRIEFDLEIGPSSRRTSNIPAQFGTRLKLLSSPIIVR